MNVRDWAGSKNNPSRIAAELPAIRAAMRLLVSSMSARWRLPEAVAGRMFKCGKFRIGQAVTSRPEPRRARDRLFADKRSNLASPHVGEKVVLQTEQMVRAAEARQSGGICFRS